MTTKYSRSTFPLHPSHYNTLGNIVFSFALLIDHVLKIKEGQSASSFTKAVFHTEQFLRKASDSEASLHILSSEFMHTLGSSGKPIIRKNLSLLVSL